MAIGLNPEQKIQTGRIQILGFISELDFKSINSGFGISGFEFSFFARFGFSVGFNFRRICKLKIYMTASWQKMKVEAETYRNNTKKWGSF